MSLPSADTIISFAALIGAVVALWKYNTKTVHFFDRIDAQEKEIKDLKEDLARKDREIREMIAEARRAENTELEQFRREINEELCINTYGLLSCLKGLQEQGCDGPVKEAVEKIEKHLNQKAHQ